MGRGGWGEGSRGLAGAGRAGVLWSLRWSPGLPGLEGHTVRPWENSKGPGPPVLGPELSLPHCDTV